MEASPLTSRMRPPRGTDAPVSEVLPDTAVSGMLNLFATRRASPRPVIGPGEILVRIAASGVCGSDVLEWYRIKKAPLVLGHEVAGTVAEVGAGVTAWRVGDRVAVTHHVPCNTCPACLGGHHTACTTLHTTNFDPGGFAEYVRVPALQTDRGVLRLPDEVSFDEGTFAEPLGCVVRAQRLARVGPGDSVLVMGSGISGLLHVALARALGAGTIMATDINPWRLEAARRFGAVGGVSRRGRRPRTGRGGDRAAGWRIASSSARARRRP